VSHLIENLEVLSPELSAVLSLAALAAPFEDVRLCGLRETCAMRENVKSETPFVSSMIKAISHYEVLRLRDVFFIDCLSPKFVI